MQESQKLHTLNTNGDSLMQDVTLVDLANAHGSSANGSDKQIAFLKKQSYHAHQINQAYQYFVKRAAEDFTVPLAGEWLLDNFYIVQQAIRQITEDMPAEYYRKLPNLAGTALAGYPRIFAIAKIILSRATSALEIGEVQAFLQEYQTIQPLAMGELWALPTMLRIVSLENLTWAICEISENPLKQSDYELPVVPDAVEVDTLVANSINNLRTLSTQDWKAFFEAVSRVDSLLRDDPSQVYSLMDFTTRNRYRSQIERYVAVMDGRREEQIAQIVVELAREAHNNDTHPRKTHIGYYLIDAGSQQLEKAIEYTPSNWQRLKRWLQAHNFFLYILSIILIMMLVVGVAFPVAASLSPLRMGLLLLIILCPISVIAVESVNWFVTRTFAPTSLPRMDYSEGIPPEHQAVIVIPALLTEEDEIESLIHQIEQHYMRNYDDQLLFALLLDYADAPQQTMPEDKPLRDYAIAQIRALNEKHASQTRKPFYLFIRRRLWNESEQVWMAWERKRGKLSEFNRFLIDPESATSFVVTEGDLNELKQSCYAITLDADTILPKGAAARLVATMAHPLNQVVFNASGDKIAAGYAVMQPRVQILPHAASQSRFTRIFAGDTSLDLYTTAASDVYQDCFGEGTYIGKGIYNIAAFEQVLKNRVPENRLLSHDLFESLYARTALVTDIVLLEDYPPHYLAYMLRLHRWIRGDWQLLPWLMSGTAQFSGLGYWKVLDNLRRSLVSPAMLALLILGWTVLPGSASFWTLLVLVASGFPFFTTLLNQLANLPQRPNWQSLSKDLEASFWRWILFLVFLPHDALIHIDAIATTIWRLIRRKNLLQWVTAAHTVRLFGAKVGIESVMLQMHTTLIIASVTTLLVAMIRPMALFVAAPFLLAWVLSLPIVSYLSKPVPGTTTRLDTDQLLQLRRIARRTWLFFEQYVGPEDNWLPPDHYQESPREITAHHTSPTNIGLLLLSTLAAYDFGYIGLPDLLTRLQLTFETMNKLERYRGHFLNWYDTRRLVILDPRYISTVDSGNLAGLLIALKAGLDNLSQQPVIGAQYGSGLADTVSVLMEVLEQSAALQESAQIADMLKELDLLRTLAETDPPQFTHLDTDLLALWEKINTLVVKLLQSEDISWDAKTAHEFRIYFDRVRHHIQNIARDEKQLLAWRSIMGEVPQQVLIQDSQTEAVWQRLSAVLEYTPTLRHASEIYERARHELAMLRNLVSDQRAVVQWCDELEASLVDAIRQVELANGQLSQLLSQIDTYIQAMDFTFLFNDTRKIFHIGYNMETQQLDNSFYDLLASEARIASLVAIATNQVPQEHWIHLSRPLTSINGVPTLKSWSGSMFEYLMPRLIMDTYPETLMDSAYHAAVNYQIHYGQRHKVPWGISESGYYAFDANMNYQYRAFGGPELAFKRGMVADMVVAPYATFLALPIMPQAVMNNAARLNAEGAYGTYGYYEAIDYTRQRLPLGETHAVVKEYMAHHQGMILLSLVNFLRDNVMVDRFHTNPYIESVQLLLQERMPGELQITNEQQTDVEILRTDTQTINTNPWQPDVIAAVPQVHYLSNGRYGLLMTSTGAGYSQWKDLELTRWYADTTCENWGMWIYLLDEDSKALWSVTQQPAPAGDYRAWFHPHQAVFRSEANGIVAQMQVTIAPDDDVEIRRVRLTNDTDEERRLFYTSYSEVVLAPRMSDQRHPAFSKLFIETEYVADLSALIFFRRQRAANEHEPYMLHMLLGSDEAVLSTRIESDRRDFMGRNHTNDAPASLVEDTREFDGIAETTIDPIMALGHHIHLMPHQSIEFAFITMAGESRVALLSVAQKYRSWATIDYAFSKARYESELELQQLEIDAPQIERFQKLLSALLYPQPGFRASSAILSRNAQGQSGLWAYGISGDYPICLIQVRDEADLSVVQDLIEAHLYWRKRNIQVTLVILNQHDTGYTQELYHQIRRMVTRMNSETWLNRHDGIFILRADQMKESDRILLAASARIYLNAADGTLEQLVNTAQENQIYLPDFIPSATLEAIQEPTPELQRPNNLLFDNGYGGFDPDTGDYVIFRTSGVVPPAPWINVIANPDFGFSVSEASGGFSWATNSSENRLTAWRNDPVQDMPGEIIYIRDEETGIIWTPTPLPTATEKPYQVRHGKGYSIFEHNAYGLEQQLTLYVDPQDPIKILRIQFKNNWDRTRRLTITYYAEWVLGTLKDITQQYIIPEYDASQRTILAHNPYSIDFGDSYLFVTGSQDFHGMTTDRREFLGRLNNYREPAALKRIGLNSTVAAGGDTCAAVQLHLNLEAGATDAVYFAIGGGVSRDEALRLSQKYQQHDEAKRAWQDSRTFWNKTLRTVEVETPELSMNLILPWLHYQALSCRIWGRSALYQSGGAYGFRDQLQDVMSVVHSAPKVAREHIQRAARHQFEAGDVLHWWHPPSGRGVRTRFSDDLIWLPFVTAYYVTTTGDTSILEEREPFLQGAPLQPDEEERYDYYQAGAETFTIYEHCRRALDKAMTQGKHGLPLMGSGDWNDGMNRVGIKGEGESVWVAWFLYTTMRDFIPLCEHMQDFDLVTQYRQKMQHYQNAIEAHAWDGNWYRRAYYDDGTPLGSVQNQECQIDSLAQSWGVLSGAAQPDRAKQAMDAMLQYLWKPDDSLLLLFTPPFDKTEKDPGYIKGYPPGVRENGGQYTHAAIWAVWALAEMGEGNRAEALFRMLNPVLHSTTQADAQAYRVEPYVIAADVYSVAPYVGMGGWTWYTGSSGWMYRLGIEAILGLVREGDKLRINPSIPSEWATYRIHYRFGDATYQIEIENPDGLSHGVGEVSVDGVSRPDLLIPLVDAKATHHVIVRLGQQGAEQQPS